MSRDIQRFITTREDRTNLSPKPPRVAPSIAPMSQTTHTMMEGYPRSSLILPSDRERGPRRDSKQTTRGEEKYVELYLRDSLALNPNVYTGSAELRGGAPLASPQQVQHVTKMGMTKRQSCEMHFLIGLHQVHMFPSSICSSSVGWTLSVVALNQWLVCWRLEKRTM